LYGSRLEKVEMAEKAGLWCRELKDRDEDVKSFGLSDEVTVLREVVLVVLLRSERGLGMSMMT
jgi:hypothetical protein